MTFQEARKLVVFEGSDQDGIVVAVRMGEIPDSARMSRLLDALKTIYEGLEGATEIDRELANGLFGLSFHIQGEVDGRISRGIATREEFVDDEMVRMFLLVESIFEDEEMFE